MILEIQHETRFDYSGPVTESATEVRLEPTSDAHQSCRSFHLRISPRVEVNRYQDGFGNRVHHFNMITPHSAICILGASVVETHTRQADPSDCPAVYPFTEAGLRLEAMDYLAFRGPIRHTALLDPILNVLRPENGTPIGVVINRISRFIRSEFVYAPDVTQASSPIDDLLREKKGVCQDFAHLMIAILRAFGVPARYVSGYIHRPGRESQSHAWVEAWLPTVGWIGIDPTNDCAINDHFVKVGVGRDFTDVPPNKGVYRGEASQTISVRVETRELPRVPPLSWQDQLPPLQVPLRAIVPPRRTVPRMDAELEQQQQQQQ